MKKKLIIIISIILICGILVCGYIFKDKIFGSKDKKLSTVWGETYYVYLKDINETKEYKKAGLPDNVKGAKVNFISVSDIKDPVMTITYDKDSKEYTNVYYINNDKVDAIVYDDSTNVKLLYDVEKDTYNYYSETVNGDTTYYKNLKDQINSKNNKDSSKTIIVEEYVFSDNDKETITDASGNEVSLSKKDEKFIEVSVQDKSFIYSSDTTKDELNKIVEKQVSIYEDISKTIEANKKVVEKLKEELVAKQEKIKSIKEENLKIEEQKKEASNEIKVGNYGIKFGTYNGQDAVEGETLILSKDGVCTFNGVACTYKVGTHDFAQDLSSEGSIKPCLIIEADYTYYYHPIDVGTLSDGDISQFVYSGN